MKFRTSKWLAMLCAASLAALPLPAFAADSPAKSGITSSTNLPPGHSLTEKAEDGRDYAITGSTRKVDANSDILVNFLDFANIAPAAPSQEWLQVSNMLQILEKVIAERAALQVRNKRVNLADAGEVARLKEDNQKFDSRVSALLTEWQLSLGAADEALFNRIRRGAFPGGSTNSLLLYPNLALWTRQQLERLNREANALVSNRTVFVTIQAFHQPVGGQLRAVHVDNYDNIAAGDYQPIDRLGLRLTPAEQERLAMEIKMAEQARDGLKEIHKAAEDGTAFASNFLAQARAVVDGFENMIKQGPTAWELKFADAGFLEGLNAAAKNNSLTDKQRAAAASNAIWLAEFKREFTVIQGEVLKMQLFKNDLVSGQARNLSDLLSSSGSGMKAITTINTLITNLGVMIQKWPPRVTAITANFVELQGQIPSDQLAVLWPEEVRKFVDQVQAAFPKTLQTFASCREFLTGRGGVGDAAAILAEADLQAIWRDDLTPGLLELARVGLTQDDTMIVKVKYRERGPDGRPGRELAPDTYKLKTVLMGLHRKFGASVIYARGLGDRPEEQQWKPNVAATVHWFYRARVEDNAWKRGWNYVNPGFGVHLASLDQGDESVEFGAGVNVSLFDNLLNGGIGVNLNNDERPYVYFGLSLLEALNKAKSIGAGKQ